MKLKTLTSIIINIIIIIIVTNPFLCLSSRVPSNSTTIRVDPKNFRIPNHKTFIIKNTSKTSLSQTTLTSLRYKTLIQQFLRPHNILRAKLHLPPLKWSNNLARYATLWGRTRSGDCNLIHSGGSYGENLFWGSGKGWKPQDAVAAWASERPNYDRRSYGCKMNKECLHYTQLVWKKSLRIGCAISSCKKSDTFVICSYDPPGNIIGQPPF